MPMLHINPAENKPRRRKKAENKGEIVSPAVKRESENMRQIVIRCGNCMIEMTPTTRVEIGKGKVMIPYRCPECKKVVIVELVCPKEEAKK